MFTALSPGALGMQVKGLADAIRLAKTAGYGGVEFGVHEVAKLIDEQGADAVRAMFDSEGVKPAGWGLPTDWRGTDEAWRKGLDELPRLAAAANAIGCGRTMTWIMPCSNDRALEENRRFHIERLKPVAEVLAAHDCRLGLEFIGPKTLRDSQRYPFIYTMGDMLAMGAEMGPNLGLLLDCWHWYTSGATVDDLLALWPEQVVYVHVSDAPPGVPMEKHIDNQRCLPGATGVIDTASFLRALQQIGYDGPVTPEPFGSPATWAADALRACWSKAGL